MKKILIGIIFYLVSTASHAVDEWLTTTIKQVYPQAKGGFVLVFNDDHQSCPNANSPQYYYVEVGKNGVTEEGSNKMYAAALTAAISGKLVSVAFDPGTNACYINRFTIIF